MKRFVIEVPDPKVGRAEPDTGASVIAGPGWKIGAGLAWQGFVPDRFVVEVQHDLPDPLPTDPGTYLLADIHRTQEDGTYPDTQRLIVVRQSTGPSGEPRAWWRSILPVNGHVWHYDEHITAWAVVTLPKLEEQP